MSDWILQSTTISYLKPLVIVTKKRGEVIIGVEFLVVSAFLQWVSHSRPSPSTHSRTVARNLRLLEVQHLPQPAEPPYTDPEAGHLSD